MNSFLQAAASQCFITGLMQRLLFLQLWDHLPPLYLVQSPFTPGLPSPVMSQEAPMAAWITLFPHHLWDIDCAAPDPCKSELKCLHGHLHIIALPKSHSEFKALLIRALRYIFAPRGSGFSLVLIWWSRRMCTSQRDFLQPSNPKCGYHWFIQQWKMVYPPLRISSTFYIHLPVQLSFITKTKA